MLQMHIRYQRKMIAQFLFYPGKLQYPEFLARENIIYSKCW